MLLTGRSFLVRLSGFVKEHCKLLSVWDSALHLKKENINNLDNA